MTNTQYGVIKPAKPEFEPRELLVVPHKGESLVTSRFGPNTYKNNLEAMQGYYSCLPQFQKMSFRPATISESISAVDYDFKNLAKPQIFDPNWLQAGYIGKTSEGVFANPPRDEQGNLIENEQVLKSYLNGTKPIQVNKGKVWIVPNKEGLRDFGFAEFESFETGVQKSEVFVQGGLAKLLEHTENPEALKRISNPKTYGLGVNVLGFEPTEGLVLRVAGLYSGRGSGGGRLNVGGSDWDGSGPGYAFVVLDQSVKRE